MWKNLCVAEINSTTVILLKRTLHIVDFLLKKLGFSALLQKSLTWAPFFDKITGSVPLDHNFIKTLFHNRLFLQNILFKNALKSLYSRCVVFTLKACNFTKTTSIIAIFVRNFQTSAINYFLQHLNLLWRTELSERLQQTISLKIF